MNVNGEGILLSEMRDAGLIQNCGWFSNLLKTVATVVAVAAVVVAVVAVCAVTCGAATPAVVAAGVATASTVSAASALTIAGYASITAAIAAGVAITVEMWEKAYPGIEVTMQNNITYAKWNDDTKEAITDITDSERKKKDPEIYFHVVKYNNASGPILVDLTNRYTINAMALKMSTLGWSSLTEKSTDALEVIVKAFNGFGTSLDFKGLPHYHATLSNKSHMSVNGFTVHSYYYSI